MEIIYLPSTIQDIEWMTHYYETVFPEGRVNMRSHFYATEAILRENSYLGHPIDDIPNTRELRITKTPFSLIYRVTATHIEVLRIWDSRRDRAVLRS